MGIHPYEYTLLSLYASFVSSLQDLFSDVPRPFSGLNPGAIMQAVPPDSRPR